MELFRYACLFFLFFLNCSLGILISLLLSCVMAEFIYEEIRVGKAKLGNLIIATIFSFPMLLLFLSAIGVGFEFFLFFFFKANFILSLIFGIILTIGQLFTTFLILMAIGYTYSKDSIWDWTPSMWGR